MWQVAMTTIKDGSMVGNYQIVRKIGAGGMGECFLASQGNQSSELVVLKMVLCGNKADAREALQEVLATPRSHNPHACAGSGDEADPPPVRRPRLSGRSCTRTWCGTWTSSRGRSRCRESSRW